MAKFQNLWCKFYKTITNIQNYNYAKRKIIKTLEEISKTNDL